MRRRTSRISLSMRAMRNPLVKSFIPLVYVFGFLLAFRLGKLGLT
jgi:hypothetical protein